MGTSQSTITLRPIPDFPGYIAGGDGSIYSRGVTRKRNMRMRLRLGSGGYLNVVLRKDGKAMCKNVHSLILLAFVGPPPEGKECCHRDGNKINNRPDNLYWGTRQENRADTERHGKTACGTKNAASKLTDEMVMEMRRRYASGETGASVRKDYPVGRTEFYKIVWGKQWKHLPVLKRVA